MHLWRVDSVQPSASTIPMRARHARQTVVPHVSVMDFDTFYRTEFAAMRALARNVSGDSAAADDLVQEAFTKAHQQWPKISNYESPGGWLRRVTINLAISRRRRIGREVSALRRKAFERQPEETEEVDDEVWDAVRKLPPRQRAVVALFYQEDRSTRDIAEILGCTVSTATSHLNQARKKLAVELGEALAEAEVDGDEDRGVER